MECLRSVLCENDLSRLKVGSLTEKIFIFFLYFALRVVGLSTRSVPTSDLAFDILACGACILFPRLVFFLIKDNVVLLAVGCYWRSSQLMCLASRYGRQIPQLHGSRQCVVGSRRRVEVKLTLSSRFQRYLLLLVDSR